MIAQSKRVEYSIDHVVFFLKRFVLVSSSTPSCSPMNSPSALSFPTKIFTGRLLVQKRKIIHPSLFLSHAIISTNQSCCGAEEKKRVELVPREVRQVVKLRESAISKPDEFIIEVPKARAAPEVLPQEKVPLFYEILSNAWPVPSERVENLTITQKRCQFSNEAVSIKPITASGFVLSSRHRSSSVWCFSSWHRQNIWTGSSRSRVRLCAAIAWLLSDAER